MKTLSINIRDVPLTVVYEYDWTFDEVYVAGIYIEGVDIYDLLGEGDREEILIKCIEDYQERISDYDAESSTEES